MKKTLLFLISLFLSALVLGQEIERVEIKGKIVVKDNDTEGVTVYNKSSEKGTITDFDGNFTIVAGLKDRIEISALQFKKFVVIVDEGIVEQKRMTIFLVEEVNKLPEIIVSPYDLTGNIIVDASRVRTVNLPFKEDEFDINLAEVDLTPDYKSKVYNPYVTGAEDPSVNRNANILGIVGLILKPLFKNKNKKTKLEKYKERIKDETKDQGVLDLRIMYTNAYMNRLFGIPEGKVNEFIVFVEENGLDYSLLSEGKEMEFVDFLVSQSKIFLDLQSEKD